MKETKNLKETKQHRYKERLELYKKSDLVVIGVVNDNVTSTDVFLDLKGKKILLPDVQKKVGGMVETVYSEFFKNHYIFCNEDGHILNLPYNKLATSLLGQYLVGNIVIVRRNLVE